jgi:hypothetical protein
VAIGLFCLCLAGSAKSEVSALSTYGTPGLVELPTAEVFDDGTLSFGISYSGITLRNTATFQVLPRLQGSFRYSITQDYRPDSPLFGGSLYDRSFDTQLQVLEQTSSIPSVAIGLRDF